MNIKPYILIVIAYHIESSEQSAYTYLNQWYADGTTLNTNTIITSAEAYNSMDPSTNINNLLLLYGE